MGRLRKRQNYQSASKWILRDYQKSNWNGLERLAAIAISALVVLILSFFFYKSFWGIFINLPIGIYFYFSYRKKAIQKNKTLLEEQFKECILAVAASLKAGYAVENAFRECEEDIKQLFGENSFMMDELRIIHRGIDMNVPIEDLLYDFSIRSGSDNVAQFVQVFSIAKQKGGNMPEIIKSSSEMIRRQIDIKSEIKVLLSGRRMELNIMKAMPFAIIGYVGITSPGYFESLYGNFVGVFVMSVCLILYVFAYLFGEKIFVNLENIM